MAQTDTRQQLGGTAGIHVDEAIAVNRPVSDVFRFWRNFENLPAFMKHLESVAERGGRRVPLGGPRAGGHAGGVGRAHHQRPPMVSPSEPDDDPWPVFRVDLRLFYV